MKEYFLYQPNLLYGHNAYQIHKLGVSWTSQTTITRVVTDQNFYLKNFLLQQKITLVETD